jgi:ADP-ribose pyrophosphatase
MINWPRIIARKVTPVSQWMTIVSRDVQFSPGAEAEIYYAIQQPSYLAAVALTPEGRILLVRQYRPAIERFSFEFPGKCENTETSARRIRRNERGPEARPVLPN